MAELKDRIINWAIPNVTIDCVLVRAKRRLEADGCVLKLTEFTSEVLSPDLLKPGDFVKVRLWLEGEDNSLNIALAEVRRVSHQWITVEIIHVGPQERSRLKRFVESRMPGHVEAVVPLDHLVIRA